MASFIDKIPEFNPYVQQLPVQAMVEVGMEKQKRYDEGVQRIQTQIDNIAGLPVIRDVDKQYLQSKINELGNNLKTVASSDFSNYQLVNSVGSMVGQIEKDSTIQNAVSSTARYRREMENMEKTRADGKSSPSNEWDFMNQANRWLNGDINSSFTGAYQQYTNYKKNALEVIKSLTKDETITDNAFTTDSKGNLVIADAIVRQKLAGISPEKIQQALMAGLTPADWKQMEIDGRYNYSNVSDADFVRHVNASYDDRKKAFMEQRTILQNALTQTPSIQDKEQITRKIEDLNKTIQNIDDEYSGIGDLFLSGNIDAAKARLQTTNFINGFSKAFAFTETSSTYVNNPFAELAMQREIKAQDWKKFSLQFEQDERQFQMNYAQKQEELALRNKALDLKKKEAIGYGGLPMDVPQEELPKYNLAKIVADKNTLDADISTMDSEFMKRNNKDQEWFNSQYQAWLKRPNGVDPLLADHFTKTEQMRRESLSIGTMISEINKEAVSKFGDIYSKLPTDIKPVMVDGQMYSPKELVDMNETMKEYIKPVSPKANRVGYLGLLEYEYDDEKAKKELSPKEFELYSTLKTGNIKGKGSLSPDRKNLFEIANQVNEEVNVSYRKTLKDINDYTAKAVTERLTSTQGVQYGIPVANAAQKTTIASVLTSLANLAENQEGKLPDSPDFDVEKARKIATDTEARYNLSVVEGTRIQPEMYEITATGKDGNVVKARISPEQKRAIFGSDFESSPSIKAVTPYLQQIRMMGGYSTATSPGPTTVQNSYLRNMDFPAVEGYSITGNIITPDGGNSFSIRLNIFDPTTGKTYTDIPYPSRMISKEQLNVALKGLNDSALFQMINATPSTSNDLNNVKNYSKKPF